MSRLIADLLSIDYREFSKTIDRLEHMCLKPGVDISLTADIITQSRYKSQMLNLDSKDTTKEELYYGLIEKAREGDLVLRKKLDFNDKTSAFVASKKIAEFSEKLLRKEKVICIQSASVKKLLKAVPPKRTMRLLKFRSIDSVLKREDPATLYALASRLEDKTWHTQIKARIKRYTSSDIKESSVKVLYLPDYWLEKLKKMEFDSILQVTPEIGSIMILPTLPISAEGSILLTFSLVLQAGQGLSIDSLPFRTRALVSGFETVLPEIASKEIKSLESVHGMTPSWHAVFRLLAKRERQNSSDFEFMLNDLEWQSTETRLASIASELDFWVGNHYLGYRTEDQQISFHVVDVAASLVLNKKYGQQITTHLKSSLQNELQLRYLEQENIEQAIITQLTMSQEIVL